MFVTGEYDPSGKVSLVKPWAAAWVQNMAVSIMANIILVALIVSMV
jgi:hypothetical protein